MYFKYIYDTLRYTTPFHFPINAFFIGYRFFIGWFSILILFMIMNSYGYKQIGN